MENIIKYEDFTKVDIRLGTIIDAKEYMKIKNPSIKLEIDFGNEIGIKKSSAQLLKYYKPKEIIGKQVAAVVNFKPKQIGNLISEVLVLGFPDQNNEPVLIIPDKKISDGGKLY